MTDETGLLLYVDGRPYDATDLTLNEVEEIEEACGGIALENLDFGRAKVLKAIVYTLLRRDDPDVSMERVGALKLRGLLHEPETNGAAVGAQSAIES